MIALAFGLAGALQAPVAEAGGSIRRWVDENGVTHFSNVPGDSPGKAVSTALPGSSPQGTRQRGIYKYRDAAGVLHYTDRKPRHGNYVVVSLFCPACDPKSRVNWDTTRLNTTAYVDEINAAAQTYGVDPALVRAIVHAESAFNPDATSRKGAQGLMQLMPATASQYGVVDAYDAKANIEAGVRHLSSLLSNFKGDVRLAAAAYNAGEGAVRKYGGVPPYDETRVYVERVGVLHKRYQSGS